MFGAGVPKALVVTSLEDQTEVVRRHFDDLAQPESGVLSNLRHRLQIAETPFPIVCTKIRIELGIAQLRVWIGRLPREASQRLGEMGDVLSRTAGNLQHNASFG